MTRQPRLPRLPLLACALAGLCSALPGNAAAQNRGGQQLFSVSAAIEEARRSPFHASEGPAIFGVAADEVRQPFSHGMARTMHLRPLTTSGPNLYFFILPVAAVLDVLALAGSDEEEEEGIDPLLSLGAMAAPPLIAKLFGARTLFAVAGSALGFSAGALFAKAFDTFGIFVAPFIHTGGAVVLSALGERARARTRGTG